MTTTLEHVESPQRASSPAPAPAPAAQDAPRTSPRTSWFTLVVEAIAAARVVSTADPRTAVAAAARFAERV